MVSVQNPNSTTVSTGLTAKLQASENMKNGLTYAALLAVINSVFGLLTAFGVNVSQDKQGAIVVFVNAICFLGIRVFHQHVIKPDAPAAPPANQENNAQ